MNRRILTLGILIIFTSCKTINKYAKSELPKIDDSKNLYAFIGKKISVIEFDPNNPIRTRIEIDSITTDTLRYESYVMDNGFKCKYVVERNLYNQIKSDTVEFKAYDHYGRPGFENYDEIVLYLSKNDEGNYYHRKYQFDPIFLDARKRYYSYPKFLGNGYLESANNLNSIKMKFPKNERFNISNISEIGIKSYYPNNYYRIEKQYAYPIRAMFLEELIEFRLRTTFKDLRGKTAGNNVYSSLLFSCLNQNYGIFGKSPNF